jgi:pimeloyl-ACP methyl ester carboxylesterase
LLPETRVGKRYDYRNGLRTVEAPVLVVRGAEDVFRSGGAGRAYAEVVPNDEVRLVEGAGQFPFYSQPEAFAQVVREFLGALE